MSGPLIPPQELDQAARALPHLRGCFQRLVECGAGMGGATSSFAMAVAAYVAAAMLQLPPDQLPDDRRAGWSSVAEGRPFDRDGG